MSSANLQVVRDRLMVQYAHEGVLYATEDHLVYRSDDRGATWKTVCLLENRNPSLLGKAKNLLLRSGMMRKMRRNVGIHNVVVLPSGTVIIQYDGIYRYETGGSCAPHVYSFSKDYVLGPLKNGLAVDDSSGNVYFGEYNNQRPYSVKIVRGSDDGRKWDICYRFPEGRIKHVHGIIPDPFRKRLWVCTGDTNEETHLFYTTDGFRTLKEFGGNSQTWRMVSLIPTPDALIWGTDAGRDAATAENYICRWRFDNNEIERLQYINKPAYYSTRLKDGTMVLGTTFEPGQEGIDEESADIWISQDGASWNKIVALPFSPSGRSNGTRYGTINFPAGDGSLTELFFTPVNVRNLDFRLMAYRP